MPDEDSLIESSCQFIKQHRCDLIRPFADEAMYPPAERPISLFMAGSPGAGKTEVSISLAKKFQSMPVRIDADEIRKICPGYNGTNAHLFQKAASRGVHILFDYALDHRLHLILDGTFAYSGAEQNIQRSLKRKRAVELWFVYQNPLKAWEFTKAREVQESRHVSKEVFIRAFFAAKRNVKQVKNTFGIDIELNLFIKNFDNKQEDFRLNITADELDHHIEDGYTEDELHKILS